jgi:hypothetical protein
MIKNVFTTLKDFPAQNERFVQNEDGTIWYMIGKEGEEELWCIHGPKYGTSSNATLASTPGNRLLSSPKAKMRNFEYGNALTTLIESPCGETTLQLSPYGEDFFTKLAQLGFFESYTGPKLKLALSLWQKGWNYYTDCLDPEDCAATYRKINKICDLCKGDGHIALTYVKVPGSSVRKPVMVDCPKCSSSQ